MISKALVAASTRPVLLSILNEGEMYGYQIIQRVIDLSGGVLDWSEGMLYPVLHRLEKEQLISARWEMSDQGRRRKYYSLTDAGRYEMEQERDQWLRVHSVLAQLWTPILSND